MATTKTAAANPMADQIECKLVEVPTLKAASYAQRRVHLELSGANAEALRDVTAALRAEGRRLSDGRAVDDPAKAVEWVLEQVRA